jgi:hypothetical protein
MNSPSGVRRASLADWARRMPGANGHLVGRTVYATIEPVGTVSDVIVDINEPFEIMGLEVRVASGGTMFAPVSIVDVESGGRLVVATALGLLEPDKVEWYLRAGRRTSESSEPVQRQT